MNDEEKTANPKKAMWKAFLSLAEGMRGGSNRDVARAVLDEEIEDMEIEAYFQKRLQESSKPSKPNGKTKRLMEQAA